MYHNYFYFNFFHRKKKENYINFKQDNIKNKNIFVLWLGGEFNENRKKGLEKIKKNTKCNIIFINKDNLRNYILKEHPLHKGFKYLSAIHQADYMRCYLMHHYGGGYTDIKPLEDSWEKGFEILKKNSNIWAVGPNTFWQHVKTCSNGNFSKKEIDNLEKKKKFISISFFIYKPKTPITTEWYNNLLKKMDIYYEKLKKNPAKFPRESKSGTPKPVWEGGSLKTKYPIIWYDILGKINFPLQVKYLSHINTSLTEPNYKDYK